MPVVAEDYGSHEEGLANYAVALIKSNLTEEISLKSLKGSKSCHPAAGDSVGWTAPVGMLIGNEAIQWKECNPYKSTGEFLQQSCVPGLWFCIRGGEKNMKTLSRFKIYKNISRLCRAVRRNCQNLVIFSPPLVCMVS